MSLADIQAMKALKLATNNKKDLQMRKIISPQTVKSMPTTMLNPPTVTLGTNGGASQITNSVLIPAINGVTPNPAFRYNGVMVQAGGSYPDWLFVKNVAINTNDFTDFFVEFDFDGLEFEYKTKSFAAPRSRILVDEGQGYQYVNSIGYSDVPSNDGGIYLRKVTFSSRALRRIKIEISPFFGGINIGPNDTLFPPIRQFGTKALFFGDSFVEGTGGDSFMGMANYTAGLLGWECWKSGSGGTGYINPGSVGGRVKFQDRVQYAVVNRKPDVVVIVGGTNDTTYIQSDIQTAAKTLYQTIQQGLPDSKIFVYANAGIGGVTTAVTNTLSSLQTAALQAGVPFIDPINGITYDSKGNVLYTSGAWFTGNGNVGGAVQSSGNRSYYVDSDNGHPSAAGHKYLGERLSTEILRVMNS